MIVKQEDYRIVDREEAINAAIECAKKELREEAEKGFNGRKYVPDSIVIKIQLQRKDIYVSAEWEEEEA